MGKITVKHYLNTNLKPYLINGEQYFSIYALVTANRQNTKVKSKVFNEYYTDNDFKEITNHKSNEDFKLIVQEEKTIINIVNMIISSIGGFDTSLFAAIYNYFENIFVFDIDIQNFTIDKKGNKTTIDLHEKTKNSLNIDISELFIKEFSLQENNGKGMSLLTWFSPVGQLELESFLQDNDCKTEAKEVLNKIIFYKSFEKLNWIFKGSKKLEALKDKYYNLFEVPAKQLEPLYKSISI